MAKMTYFANMAEFVLELSKSVMLLKICEGKLFILFLLKYPYLITYKQMSFNQPMFLSHYITQGEDMFLCLCEYSDFNHTSSMIFFIIVHMLKRV